MEFARLADMSAHWATTTPDKTAILYEGRSESWAGLHARVLAAAGALRKAGVKPGDRVGHMGLNHPAHVVLMCACFRLGAIMTPINWRLVAGEVAYVLNDAGIGLLLADRAFGPVIAGAGVAGLTIVWTDELDTFLADAEPDARLAPTGPETVALQLYTSGTTGFPKGALLTNASLLGTIAKGALTGIRMVRIDRRSGRRVFGVWPSNAPKAAVIWEAFKPETEPRRIVGPPPPRAIAAGVGRRIRTDSDFLAE